MNPKLQQQIANNLFPSSHAAIRDAFPWHISNGTIDTWQPNSSQALAIDVFGTLKTCNPEDRNGILGSIAENLGLPPKGPWSVELEWTDPQNRLRESGQQTQVDALARSPETLMFFECKFTESDGGPCSQPRSTAKGEDKPQCSGNHESQGSVDHPARCVLTRKGIRYWDFIPEVFALDRDEDYRPCPFAGPWYQWMRNIVLCHLVAKEERLKPGFMLVYADAKTLHVPRMLLSREWKQFLGLLRPNALPVQPLSYQSFLAKARETANTQPAIWIDLSKWVDDKIASVAK